MSFKRVLLALLAVMAMIFALDFLVHHTLLRADYDAIRPMLRPRDGTRFGQNWFFLSELLLALPMVVLYARSSFFRSSLANTLLFGLIAGLLAYGHSAFIYALMPLPLALCGKWLGYGVAKCLLCALTLRVTLR
jgi:uncharacterized membrane protein YczE